MTIRCMRASTPTLNIDGDGVEAANDGRWVAAVAPEDIVLRVDAEPSTSEGLLVITVKPWQ